MSFKHVNTTFWLFNCWIIIFCIFRRSFFVRKAPLSTSSTSDGDGSKNSPSPVKKVKSPIEKKEKTPKEKKEKTPKEKKVKTPIEKKVKTPFEKKDQKSIM